MKDPENYMRNARRTNNSNRKESISQRKVVYLSKIRFYFTLHKMHEIWKFWNGMKTTVPRDEERNGGIIILLHEMESVESTETKRNGETEYSIKVKQQHLKQTIKNRICHLRFREEKKKRMKESDLSGKEIGHHYPESLEFQNV
jgi:hypothetical protein